MNAVVIEAAAQHTASLVFLHGLGDTGHGWAQALRVFAQKFLFMRFILPHAPKRQVEFTGNRVLPAWYNIHSLREDDEREDIAGLGQSAETVLALVNGEIAAGIAPERIFLAGFSQGGAVSLFTALTEDLHLGGIICLSGYIPAHRTLLRMSLEPLRAPIFLGHGTADSVVLYSWFEKSTVFLRQLGGKPLVTRSYAGVAHTVSEEGLADVQRFIAKQLEGSLREL